MKKPKKEVKKIIEKYDIPKWTFWRMCTSYFQSGFQDYSLVDAKYFANWCQKQRYHRNGKLSKEKIEKLKILGFIFDNRRHSRRGRVTKSSTSHVGKEE